MEDFLFPVMKDILRLIQGASSVPRASKASWSIYNRVQLPFILPLIQPSLTSYDLDNWEATQSWLLPSHVCKYRRKFSL